MANERQKDRRKVIRRKENRRRGATRTIKVEGKEEKGREVTVGREADPRAKEKSLWSWHEEFAVEWSESLITKKRERHRRKGA